MAAFSFAAGQREAAAIRGHLRGFDSARRGAGPKTRRWPENNAS